MADCLDAAARDSLCWTHYGRLRKGKSIGTPKDKRKAGMTPLQRLTEAAITYTEASVDDDRAWRRALDNLSAAAERYVKKLWAERTRDELKAARRRGVKLGRPPGAQRTGSSRTTRWRKMRALFHTQRENPVS